MRHTIVLDYTELLREAERAIAYIAKQTVASEADPTPYERIATTEYDKDMLLEVKASAEMDLVRALHEYVAGLMLDGDTTTITIETPDNVLDALLTSIDKDCARFVGDKIVAAWLAKASAPQAALYTEQATKTLQDIIAASHSRQRPPRR